MWHSDFTMKALKSDLAKRVLSDPRASRQLAEYLALQPSARNEQTKAQNQNLVLDVADKNGEIIHVKAFMVPKA